MGCNPLARKCSSSPYAAPDSNPNPAVFTILTEKMIGKFLVLHVNYPNCTNFEGHKLMVYKGFKNSKDLLRLNNGKLDPHFSNKRGSPIARFAPVQSSIDLIEKMAKFD